MSLKIAVITETFYPFNGGSAKRYLEIFSRLAKYGYDVDIYTVRLNEDWDYMEEYRGINIIRSDEALPRYITNDGFRDVTSIFKYLIWLYKRFNPRDYDVIEVNHCPIFPVILAGVKRRSNQPLVSTVHEVWFDEWINYVPNKLYAPLGMALEKLMMYIPDYFISVSRFTSDRMVKLLRVDPRKIVTIYNGVNLELYRRVNVGKDIERIVYGGRLNPHKRLDLLLRSFEILYRSYDVKLDIFGAGPMRNYIEGYVGRNGLSKVVKLYGEVSEDKFVYLMKRGYIYVLPSIREGQSITTLEAMAAGTPQVTVKARNNAAYTLVGEAGSGFISKLDPKDISSKIATLLDDVYLWSRFRDNGLSFASRYSWDKIAEMHRIIYESLSRR